MFFERQTRTKRVLHSLRDYMLRNWLGVETRLDNMTNLRLTQEKLKILVVFRRLPKKIDDISEINDKEDFERIWSFLQGSEDDVKVQNR